LRKAFDKTCGGSASHEPNPTVASKDERNAGNSKMLMNRRKLSMVGSDIALNAIESVKNMIPRGQWEKLNSSFRHSKVQKRRTMESSQENLVENTEDNNLQSQQQRQEQQQQQDQQQQKEENEKHLSPTDPTSDEDVSENTIEGALLLNTDYLIVNNSTTEKDSIQGGQGENFEKRSNDENAVVNHAIHSKSNDIDSSSLTTTTTTTHVPETTISIQTCCRSILKIFHDECDTPEEEEFNDKRLFVIVCVIALCGVVKSLIRHFKLRWLPEAGGCILVGMFGGLFLRFLPNMDFGFQHDMFLRLMVPPIGKAIYVLLVLKGCVDVCIMMIFEF
jgi:NhaP-type Na+/H+ and K+/H+ antiporters